MDSWKSFITLQEIKKPSCKYLRVWAKNQLRFKIYIQKSQWKIDLLPNLSHIFQDFCNFIHLWNKQKLGCWGGLNPGLKGAFDSGWGRLLWVCRNPWIMTQNKRTFLHATAAVSFDILFTLIWFIFLHQHTSIVNSIISRESIKYHSLQFGADWEKITYLYRIA